MTNDLAALSEAATQGEWAVCVYDCGDTPHYDANGSCPSIQSKSEDCAIVHWDGFKQEYWTSANGNQRQIEANAALIIALVNEYRAGRLAHLPEGHEGLRERVAWRMWKAEADRAAPNVGRNRTLEAFQNDTLPDERERWLGLADAAIAAMLSEGKP